MDASRPEIVADLGGEPTAFGSRSAQRHAGKAQGNKRSPGIGFPGPRSPARGVDFRPMAFAMRQTAAWRGMSGEVVRISERKAFECHYCGPAHLLIAYHRGVREKGDTALDDLPPSTLHDLSGKLTFVPAGSWFRERHEPSGPIHVTYLHIDPHGPLMDPDPGSSAVALLPHMFFENRALWETCSKLTALIEAGLTTCSRYAEALGVVLGHELLLLDSGSNPTGPALQGGLANWQRNAVAEYIEENLDNHVSLTRLAEIARLSPFHFSRAFKASFGAPPHRYHMDRRIDWAKQLLAKPSLSVTDIALEVGFANTSSFSVAFRSLVGRSPREYRRGLL